MNIGLNLKIRKNEEQSGHRRTKTDYMNVKKLVDNFAKPPPNQSASKISKHAQFGVQVKQKSMRTGHNRAHNKSNFCQSVLNTEYHEKGSSKKNQTVNLKIDLNCKKSFKSHVETRQSQRTLQVVEKAKQRYEMQTKVGSGTFGTVHKARDKKTLEMVAIKKVYQDRKYKNRQLQILKMLKHPNVLQMKDHFFSYQGDKQYLNVVMEFFPSNLYDFIQTLKTKRISKLKLKVITYQLFKGLLYLQQKKIAHRDIKPQNILIRESDLKVVICDFGSAKVLVPGQQNISYICSRCYRAPELIFQNTQYSTQIDVWSTGCVLIQIITGVPVFRANSNLEQLIQIMKVLGTPTRSQILQMNPSYNLQKFQLPRVPKKEWTKVFKTNNLQDQFLNLIEGVMKYSPNQRLTPLQVLQHKYFDQLRMQSVYEHLRLECNMPELFNIAQELNTDKYNELVPRWFFRKDE